MSKHNSYYVKTFGCQMNEADAEKIVGYYEVNGWQPAVIMEDADELVIVSCSVRESAENRVMGLINNILGIRKKEVGIKKPKIIVTGCILYHPLRWLKEKMPGVDEFRKIEKFNFNADLTPSVIPSERSESRNLGHSKKDPSTSVGMTTMGGSSNSKFLIPNSSPALVPIMNGCNHFCSYCVVPYARGREISRLFDEIVCEVEKLANNGAKEITLLGQNVNSYKPSFARLLRRIHEIGGIEKISFLTSNPWDLSDEIIEAMTLPKVDRYFHLAVQSGDDGMLKKMNRGYTAGEYLKLTKKLRKKIPDIKIGTDIIVGFPGESEEAFNNTLALCQKVGFEKAYVAMYSPRQKTAASKLPDNVPHKEKEKRRKILDRLINDKQIPCENVIPDRQYTNDPGSYLIICGPTATGKTSLALKLAKRFNGELVSADSRQVYRGMDIGTGKDLPVRSKFHDEGGLDMGYYLFDGVRVWLLDVVDPDYKFSVADWVKCADKVINDIQRRGKLPIVVGGTGFYIKALLKGVDSLGVEPDWDLREKWQTCLPAGRVAKLQNELGKVWPEKYAGMNESDRNNPRRLIRAIEIAMQNQKSKCKNQNDKSKLKISEALRKKDALCIGLRAFSSILYGRIDRRVEERIKNGLEKEIESLLDKGYDFDNSALGTTLAYKQWQPFFGDSKMQSGKVSELKEKIIERWKNDEHAYAKRQMTWFKKMQDVNWYDTEKKGWESGVVKLVAQWYSKNSNDTKEN